MSFFKKLTETVSKGVSTATEKAQQTVEITKLHSQIAGKRKEIERQYNDIGEAVYKAYLAGDLSRAETEVIPACQSIADKDREIGALEDRIRELRNEKECECGQRVPFQTRFCPACGKPFPEPAPVPAAEAPDGGELSVLSEDAEPVRASAIDIYPEAESGEEAWAASRSVPEDEPAANEPEPAPVLPVVHVCTACGAEMPEEARFCQDCGNPMYP
ncbi:zinc ribbon domain-containing protein [Cohnella rhizosphaerae]|uniref:Zinc ribbon domain-containing protein n=1 Tax=Cohnella rhizosphaerae TaxID=1457232 RepID=A0A9X4QW86_9BACL|nr:zinc ribbon domain-containing protein [Cohnella rhizosphaerae]MDG0813238.1 zinc ribbon domain-containing protein [Cohnella rhizosphaerae]